MNRSEAEKLLGGYATGILTESEKRALFTAALEHQELFDALMGEEALRELLADPVVRERLLALLEEPVRRPAFWRRPAVLGLAASLFLLVTTSLVVLRRSSPPPVLAMKGTVKAEEKAGPDTSDSASLPSAAPSPASPPPVTRRSKANALPRAAQSAAPPPEPPQATMTPPAPESEAMPSRAEQQAKAEGMKAAAGVMAKAAKAPAAADAAMVGAKAEADEEATSGFRLTPVLVRLPDGRYRLGIIRGSEGHLYVIKRTPSGPAVLMPTAGPNGHMVSFELSLGGEDALDVYLLRDPVPDPAALPASSEVPGQWLRVYPK